MNRQNWSDDNSSQKSGVSDGISTISSISSPINSHYQEDLYASQSRQNNISNPEETTKHLTVLLNNILNSRGDYDILDNILRKRQLEIVVKLNPSDIIDDTDLNMISSEEKAEARNFIIRVLTRQQQMYSERNFHHLDNLSLKRMIPDIIYHWKKKTDPESVTISLPLPLVAPMITTPIRDRFLVPVNNDSVPITESTYVKPHPLMMANSGMSLEDCFDDSLSAASSISGLTSVSSHDNVVGLNRISSIDNINQPHIITASNIHPPNSHPGISHPSNSHPGTTHLPNSHPPKRINAHTNFISKPVARDAAVNISSQVDHGRSKKEQLESYIELCQPTTVIINATEVYNAYCQWCEQRSYEKYTRPMFTKSLRERWGDYEIKSDTGRSKGWTIMLPV